MSEQLSFIETQFPVSKISKESYKERKSSQGQTITGLGKWWGRKPLIVVRAALIGCLMPSSGNPKKDTDIFLKILSMDPEGLQRRKERHISTKELYDAVSSSHKLTGKYLDWFCDSDGKISLDKKAPKDEIENAVFNTLGYDQKLNLCIRPEQLENISEDAWNDINHHLGTSACTLTDLVHQLSEKRFHHNVVVGDCFCGGGSIPFEAARIGCDAYASDLNPIAGMLTWADLNIACADDKTRKEIQEYQHDVYDRVDEVLTELGIEHNEFGDRALSYLYCVESDCPECGYRVPMLPSLVVGIRAGRVVAELEEKDDKSFRIKIRDSASVKDISEAQKNGTVRNNALVCPHCGMSTPITSLRHDTMSSDGNITYGLRQWKQSEFESRPNDIYHERLYCIRYEREDGSRYYCEPSQRDIRNEKIIHDAVSAEFIKWQACGSIPSSEIESGYNTDQIIRERGWKFWHQLFNARQLFVIHILNEVAISLADTKEKLTAAILGLNKCLDFSSKLCRWDPSTDKIAQTFYNQAFNTLMNYGARSWLMLKAPWFITFNGSETNGVKCVELHDSRDVSSNSDIWITDPPYADAVNYHELSEFFLAWDKTIIQKAFPEWYTDSKRILAVKGDDHFSQTMIEIYSNLTKHMPDNGMQVVMFTHSDPAVWAQLAIIMWRSGLKVTAAWNIATETDASGIKSGNYVKGTVLLVLRKQTGTEMAFLDEINVDIRSEVKRQIASMQELDDKEEPNFADPDYVLAAYAASLKVLTSYAEIEDLDLDYELNQAITNPSGSKIVGIIENAKKVAYDCVIPLEFDSFLWRDLTNAEKFYIKGIESEKHGNYQIGTYQEFARGFSIAGYSQLMASERANTARLKTPFEMGGRSMNDVPDFETSLMRSIFQAIYAGVKEDMNPNKALGFLKNDIHDYWDKREMIKQILSFLIDIKDITNMQPHWTESAEMADQLLALVTHDSI